MFIAVACRGTGVGTERVPPLDEFSAPAAGNDHGISVYAYVGRLRHVRLRRQMTGHHSSAQPAFYFHSLRVGFFDSFQFLFPGDTAKYRVTASFTASHFIALGTEVTDSAGALAVNEMAGAVRTAFGLGLNHSIQRDVATVVVGSRGRGVDIDTFTILVDLPLQSRIFDNHKSHGLSG